MNPTIDPARMKGFSTRAIHIGQAPDPSTGAIMQPIFATSTYVQESPGKHKGFEYSRTQNPTRMALERCVAGLEGGSLGLAFGSGLAATATVLDHLQGGQPRRRAGRRLRRHLPALRAACSGHGGARLQLRDISNMANVEAAIRAETLLIRIVPTNPLLKTVDPGACAAIAGKRKRWPSPTTPS